MRRLNRLGFKFQNYNGTASQLLRSIYQRKAAQSSSSLFHDPVRIEFIVRAAALLPDMFDVYTLEDESNMAAALVTLRDRGFRRFYTGCFAPELAKHSPALVLIYEVTRQSLEQGFSCDYMTGEQDYKMRLATATMPLYRVRVSAEELRTLAAGFTKLPIAG
jgi:CelD/BcsL family acetyltransferase involved in cellulose biosynthesis